MNTILPNLEFLFLQGRITSDNFKEAFKEVKNGNRELRSRNEYTMKHARRLAVKIMLKYAVNPKPKGEFVKKQHCKKATRVCKLNSFSDEIQRWKLNGLMLKNKEGAWKSDDNWEFKPQINGLIYIENTSKTKVLGSTSDGKVIEEVKVEGKAEQLWKKGEPDAEGYFTLQNSGEPKVLTAISESSLEIIGMR